ncbi:hypothetical protein R1flu_016228 [Riccia fluitans]|uniref:Uncharacterized protein n=1 Tax=Riccia fluitans TaxID=41844 RepID=A0ABD1YPB0_9MARC
MATLPTSYGMIDPHSGSVGITSIASDSCSSSCGSPPKTFNMRDLLNAAQKTPFGNGGSVMLQPSGSKKRIEKNVSTGSRHRMNRKEYEMIMGYLEDPEHLVEILGSERKTKVSGKHPSKQIAFGVMAVHLASLGNEGGSPVEGDEPAHAKKGGSGGEGDEIAHAETETFNDEFGDDGGAPDDETGRRPEEELEF